MESSLSLRRLLAHLLFGLLFITSLSACAPQNPRDPLEPYNRKVFAFNRVVDKVAFRPVAVVYHTITPKFVNVGVTNFFGNLNEINAIANDVLQFRLGYTLSDAWRLIINSTIGVLGLFDVATKVGLPKHQQDFGLTLARWGFKSSPYFVLPFLGPSTLRDALALPVDYYLISAWPYIDTEDGLRASLAALCLVDMRADLLHADKLVDKAFDPYVFVREAYLQKRASLIDQVKHQQSHQQLMDEVLDLSD